MKILFINLADPEVLGKQSSEALARKHKPSFLIKKPKVTMLQLMQSALEYGKTSHFSLNKQDLKTLQAWLKHRKGNDKIIIAAHGKKEDAEFCYAESDETDVFKTHKLLSAQQLAEFIKHILIMDSGKQRFNLTLSICYGARSQEHEKNHLLHPGEIDWASSFAAKVYASILDFNVKLKAVTGAVQFDSITGSLLVETEEGILAANAQRNSVKAIKQFDQEVISPLVEQFIQQYGKDRFNEYLVKGEYRQNQTALDKAFVEIHQMEEQLKQLTHLKFSNDKKNYGQVIFEYEPRQNRIVISLKHLGNHSLLRTMHREEFVKSPIESAIGFNEELELNSKSIFSSNY
nr:hypothetical protein [Legionella jordanis]